MDEEYTKMEKEQMIMDYWQAVIEREQEYGD